MELIVIGTGSKGNCYLLKSSNECLIIEAGCKLIEVKKALNFNIQNIKGMLVSHEHLDHAKYISEFTKIGIKTYSNQSVFNKFNSLNTPIQVIKKNKTYQIGSFKVMPFEAKHDVECYSFLIEHQECGKIVFVTDSYYVKYRFKNIKHWIIEANYSKKIIDKKIEESGINLFLKDRILKSHLSLENCIAALKSNDLSNTENIILIHLSDSNSNEKEFKQEIEKQVQRNCVVANNGMNINLNQF
jgi:phosphoribosyl 1,2-cyclic phosphodiesterase